MLLYLENIFNDNIIIIYEIIISKIENENKTKQKQACQMKNLFPRAGHSWGLTHGAIAEAGRLRKHYPQVKCARMDTCQWKIGFCWLLLT